MSITVETCGKAYCEHYPEGLPVCAKCREESTLAHDIACAKLAEARAEIEHKNKLIEQMLEALENIRDYPGHIDYTTGEVHSMQEIAIAALAAERGE